MTRKEICDSMTLQDAVNVLRETNCYGTMDIAKTVIIEALEEQKITVALERYKDLQDYFGDASLAKAVLENPKEFKAWLERLRWNTKKVDELARKLEALEKQPSEELHTKKKKKERE